MRDIKLNSDNDIELTNGSAALTTDAEDVMQELEIRLQFFSGEWFLNILEGIPYLEEILNKGANLDAVKALFVNEILSSNGITELVSLNLTFNNRILRVDFSAKADNLVITKTINIKV